ncbi:hypothetical protein H0Z60_10625 [Ectothiorhodospiraceae bacterium WFHF3C12]|nr:hypothetical protein [Ectothiorhodospiraceae bacterium WFHF3C12]
MLRTTLLLLPLLLTACSTLGLSGNRDSFILNERLADAYEAGEYTMRRGRAPLVMSSGRSVDNCVAYLEAGGHPEVAGDVNSRITPAQYLVCDTMAALKDARPLEKDDYRPDDYGEALKSRLDLGSFQSSVSRTLEGAGPTLDEIEGLRVAVTEHGVVADARDWVLELRTVAVGHLDDNNRPDWLVWLHDESNAGMYRAHRLLIVPDVGAEGLLRAVRYQP